MGPDVTGTVVCDLDGVLYLSKQAVPGAGAALGELADRGYRIVAVTNNSTTTPQRVADKISRVTGFDLDPAFVVTSGLATVAMLAGAARRAFVIGEEGLVETLAAHGIESVGDAAGADAVIVGLDRGVDYPKLRDATLAIRSGVPFIATNTDPTYPTPEGLWPGGGAITAALQASTDVEPLVAGKPHEPIRSLTRRLVQGPTWMVGDRIDTDIEMGRLEGWTTVLVLSGVTRFAPAGREVAHHVIDSIADLPKLIAGAS